MQSISMFELTSPTYKIEKPIRLIELFAGVGSQAMALRNLGLDFEHHRVVEFDKYAIESYNAIHDTNFPTMDITKTKGEDLGITETDKYTYILTYSFPCQDLSLAGKGRGMSRDGGTRSGLLWEVERLLKEVKELPEVLLMENVPQVIGQKNIQDFRQWQYFLEDLGYSNFVDTLNAKNYGVAQNRERTFMVSILGDWYYKFPLPVKLDKTIQHYLEDEVEEKFYLNNDKADKLIEQLIEKGQLSEGINFADGSINDPNTKDYMNCITARYDCGISNQKSIGGVVIGSIYAHNSKEFDTNLLKYTTRTLKANKHDTSAVMQVGNIVGTGNWDNPQRGRIYSPDGCSPSLNTVGGGGLEPKIVESKLLTPDNFSHKAGDGTSTRKRRIADIHPALQANPGSTQATYLATPIKVKQATKQGYIECKPGGVADLSYPTSETRRGRVEGNGDIFPTLTTGEPSIHRLESAYRIRKLTPLECWRLMGFRDEDFYKAEKVNSNSQLYKQAGNSIVVDVLEGIFNQMIGVV